MFWILFAITSAAFAFGPDEATAILSKHCYSCHGSAAMAGLRLDQPGDLADGIVVPGKPEDSRLWLMMNGKGRAVMPPTGKLKDADLAVIRDWIKTGAKWPAKAAKVEAPSWWAFTPVKPLASPKAGPGSIDAFIAAKLTEKGLAPSKEADRRTLIRRVSFDLTGLPPTAAEIAAFEADGDYERMVDRYLASKHYGEKWSKNWRDLVRYGNTAGFERGPYTRYAWP